MSEKAKPKKVDPEVERVDSLIAEAEKKKYKLGIRGAHIDYKMAEFSEKIESLKKIRERLGG